MTDRFTSPSGLKWVRILVFLLVLGVFGWLLFAFRSEEIENPELGIHTYHYRWNQRVGFDLDTDFDGDAEVRVRERLGSPTETWQDWNNDGVFEIYTKKAPGVSLFTFDSNADGRPDFIVRGSDVDRLWKRLAQEKLLIAKLKILQDMTASQASRHDDWRSGLR